MPQRLQAIEPSSAQLDLAKDITADLRGDNAGPTLGSTVGLGDALDMGPVPPTTRTENGYRVARQWTADQGIELNDQEEQRLVLAYARVEARDGAARDNPGGIGSEKVLEPVEFSSIDYARMMIVDASLQRTAAEALEMDIMDREMALSWINPDLRSKPWFQADISPSDVGGFSEKDMTEIASGDFQNVSHYQRETLELMLLRGGSERNESLDKQLYRTNEKMFLHTDVREYEFTPAAEMKPIVERCQRLDEDRFGVHFNRGGLTTKELGGLVERFELARHHDRWAGKERPGPGEAINPRFAVRGEDKEFAALVVRDVMNGKVKTRLDSAVRTALEYQQERGVPLDRAAFKRMESAVARMSHDDGRRHLSDVDRAKELLIDTSIQAMANEKLTRPILVGARDRVSPSEAIITDIVGKGSVPTFTRAGAERSDTENASSGHFERIGDDRGVASAIRIAFHRGGRELDGEIASRLKALVRENPAGKAQDKHWVEEKANRLDGASKLRGLTRGPETDMLPLSRAAGIGR
jgi:hypothetical protein